MLNARISWRFALALGIGLTQFLTFGSGRAQIEAKVGDRFGDWTFGCQAVTARKAICALTQTIVEKETRKPIVHLALRRLEKDQTLALIAVLPLEVSLAAGVGGKVDGGQQFNLIWQHCTINGCQAAVSLDDSVKQALQTGKQLVIGFKVRTKSEASYVGASLKGVTAGFKALGIN